MVPILNKLATQVITEIWGDSLSDGNYLVKPAQLSDNLGEIGVLDLGHERIPMPTAGYRYAVYGIGRYHPERLGVDSALDFWKPIPEVMDRNGLIIMFSLNHNMLDLSNAYMMRAQSGNLMLAFRTDQYRDLFMTDYERYVRFYSNVWYEENASARPYVNGTLIGELTDASPVLSNYIDLKNAGEDPMLFVNGSITEDISMSELSPGDSLHLLQDYSFDHYVDVPLIGISSYTSRDDNRRYYILPCESGEVNEIHHVDDVDFYIMGQRVFGANISRDSGFYIPRLTKEHIRMLTSCDYAIDADYLDAIIGQVDSYFVDGSKFVRCMKRKNDSHKTVHGDSNYSRHLHRLDTETRLSFMTGVNSGFTYWRAEELDSSKFMKLVDMSAGEMGSVAASPYTSLTDVFSYFGLLEILQSNKYVDGVPEYSTMDSVTGCQLFTFNQDGSLQSIAERNADQSVGTIYPPGSTDLGLTYPISRRDVAAQDTYSAATDSESEVDEIRLIVDPINGTRKLAEEGADFTFVDGGGVTWDASIDVSKVVYRRADDIVQIMHSGFTRADIGTAIKVLGDTVNESLGYSHVDVYLQNKKLHQGIDFYRVGLKEIVIVKTQGLTDAPMGLVTICRGLPPEFTTSYPAPEFGWIKHGKISNDNHYDFYVDTNSNIFVGGRYLRQKDIKRAEDNVGSFPAWVVDGMPYSIEPKIQYVQESLVKHLTSGRSIAYSSLNQAENAVNAIQGDPEDSGTLFISEKYDLVSPFMYSLIKAVKDGELAPSVPGESEPALAYRIREYADLLDVDPCNVNTVDLQMVDIYPTPYNGSVDDLITVTAEEYAFFARVNEVYLNNRCRLNDGLAIGS